MNLDTLAPIVLIGIAVVVLLGTQVVGPRRARRRLERVLAARGWLAVDGETEPAWSAVMRLALGGSSGMALETATEERVGPFSVHYERSEKRSGRTRSLYRLDGARRPRFAADGLRTTRVVSRAGRALPRHKRTTTTARELWLGEPVAWDVAAPEQVFSAAVEMFGDAARARAIGRQVDPESIPQLRTPSADNPTLALREALLRTATAHQALASVFVGPGGWVLTAPLVRGSTHLDALLDLADELSSVVDAVAGA